MGSFVIDRRLFPLSVKFFRQEVEPLIAGHHKRPGRPPSGRHMTSFSLAVLFVLRTGVSWRDLPSCFGNWHTVYTRFKHVRENGHFWSLLYRLQQRKKIKMDLVWIDITTVSLAPSRVWGIKKQNPPLGGEERAEALKIHVGLLSRVPLQCLFVCKQ